MRSIRSTLLLGTITGSASLLLVVMVALLHLLRSLIVEHFDGSLGDTAQSIQLGIEQISPKKLSLELDELDVREFARKEQPAYFQAWLDDGTPIYRSPSLGKADLPRFSGATGVPEYRWLALPDGRPGRAVGLAAFPRRESEGEGEDAGDGELHVRVEPGKPTAVRVTVVVARETTPIHGPWQRFGVLVGVVGGAALALSTGVLWFIIRRSLRPLDRIAGRIGGLDPDDRSARVQLGSTPLEVQPIVDRLNGLLGKVEAAFERERSLTADVAHELRTPLAGIRMATEVALSRLRGSEQYREALGECRTIAVQMQDTVENLLSLARIEAGLARIDVHRLSVRESLQAAWRLLEPGAAARRLRVEWSLDGEVPITTDPTMLDIVLRNLLQNAVEYADERGTVEVAASSAGGRLELRVRNTGSRLTQEEAERVFDRFWRGDEARASTGVHCGMGLALVKSIASLLGGSARVTSRAGGEFQIDISIPDRAGPLPPAAKESHQPAIDARHRAAPGAHSLDGAPRDPTTVLSASTHQEDT